MHGITFIFVNNVANHRACTNIHDNKLIRMMLVHICVGNVVLVMWFRLLGNLFFSNDCNASIMGTNAYAD